KTGMIVSGLIPLQLFNQQVYKNRGLETYCLLKRCDDVGKWYQSIGYAFEPAQKQEATFKEDYKQTTHRGGPQYRSPNIARVWNFESVAGLKIQLIGTRIIPEAVVLEFHSTCIMNILTQKAAYALFPYITFKQQATLLVNAKGELLRKYKSTRKKYKHHGFKVERLPDIEQIVGKHRELGFATPQWIGDSKIWKHEVEYFGPGMVQPDNVQRVSWDMIYDPSRMLPSAVTSCV
ncbi:uncharacterized protein C8R40DRAFT_1064344, partial [Lentinula edodes]|uniref:uncharacterized protein n=1 Tax=Lentinula edodes TaxID=5353 RepID=UPI001E8E42B5